MKVKKYITKSIHLEVGDFYGSGEDEVISVMEREDNTLTVTTGVGVYHFALKPQDYLLFEDGTWEIIQSPFDKEDK